MRAHELARQLLAGPDLPVVIATYDDRDELQHHEAVKCSEIPEHYRWYDSSSFPRHESAVALSSHEPDR